MCGSDKDGVSRHCFVYRLWVGEGGRGVIIKLFKINQVFIKKKKDKKIGEEASLEKISKMVWY